MSADEGAPLAAWIRRRMDRYGPDPRPGILAIARRLGLPDYPNDHFEEDQ